MIVQTCHNIYVTSNVICRQKKSDYRNELNKPSETQKRDGDDKTPRMRRYANTYFCFSHKMSSSSNCHGKVRRCDARRMSGWQRLNNRRCNCKNAQSSCSSRPKRQRKRRELCKVNCTVKRVNFDRWWWSENQRLTSSVAPCNIPHRQTSRPCYHFSRNWERQSIKTKTHSKKSRTSRPLLSNKICVTETLKRY